LKLLAIICCLLPAVRNRVVAEGLLLLHSQLVSPSWSKVIWTATFFSYSLNVAPDFLLTPWRPNSGDACVRRFYRKTHAATFSSACCCARKATNSFKESRLLQLYHILNRLENRLQLAYVIGVQKMEHWNYGKFARIFTAVTRCSFYEHDLLLKEIRAFLAPLPFSPSTLLIRTSNDMSLE